MWVDVNVMTLQCTRKLPEQHLVREAPKRTKKLSVFFNRPICIIVKESIAKALKLHIAKLLINHAYTQALHKVQ